jgi:hypothetical protein
MVWLNVIQLSGVHFTNMCVPLRSGLDKVRFDQVRLDQDRLDQVRLYQDRFDQVRLGKVRYQVT